MSTITIPAFLPARVTVTAEHIRHGVPGECGNCPIALALAEAINNPAWFAHIQVFIVKAVVLSDDGTWSVTLPEQAQAFIASFDTAHEVEPFEFGLTWREGDET